MSLEKKSEDANVKQAECEPEAEELDWDGYSATLEQKNGDNCEVAQLLQRLEQREEELRRLQEEREHLLELSQQAIEDLQSEEEKVDTLTKQKTQLQMHAEDVSVHRHTAQTAHSSRSVSRLKAHAPRSALFEALINISWKMIDHQSKQHLALALEYQLDEVRQRRLEPEEIHGGPQTHSGPGRMEQRNGLNGTEQEMSRLQTDDALKRRSQQQQIDARAGLAIGRTGSFPGGPMPFWADPRLLLSTGLSNSDHKPAGQKKRFVSMDHDRQRCSAQRFIEVCGKVMEKQRRSCWTGDSVWGFCLSNAQTILRLDDERKTLIKGREGELETTETNSAPDRGNATPSPPPPPADNVDRAPAPATTLPGPRIQLQSLSQYSHNRLV
ncbi:hypothetical protein WMY93_009892 [Mugilogobius chulae]|uniref:Uncharacterized protein n=1 Tax=Mugilogobius chulae TaxID=88201 RepID=A0AAW0P602_9GOBI